MARQDESSALDLVAEALEISVAERTRWLQERCGNDLALRAEVESLLGFGNVAEGLLRTSDGASDQLLSATRAPGLGREIVATLEKGDRLGEYQIQRQIGAGGMGVVYEAKQMSLNRVVALKVLPAYLCGSPNALARFQREVEAAARLRHDNIVAVHTTGAEGGNSYYAMELIDGPALSEVLTDLRHDPIPELQQSADAKPRTEPLELPSERLLRPKWLSELLTCGSPSTRPVKLADSPDPSRLGTNYFEVVANLLIGVADALDYAHSNNVIHRDIKPSNLLLSSDARLHISDFGLARIIAEPGVTQTGDIVGTPFYMAPEQISSDVGKVDGRTDVYALGATLYELLTLRPPLPGSSRDEVISKILLEDSIPPRRINKRIPRDLETICLQALEKEPARRYQTAGQMAEDLRCYASHWPITAKRSGVVQRTAKWCRRHRAMAGSLLVAGVLGLVAVFLAYRAHESTREKTLAEQQRDHVVARASRIEQDLNTAKQAVVRAQQNEQERVFQEALVAAIQGDQQAVADAIERAEQFGASPLRLHILRAQSALFRADLAGSIKELESAIAISPDSFAANALLVESFARVDKWQLSRELLKKVNSMQPQSTEDLILKGRMQSFHDPQVAEQILDHAIAIDKQNVAARLIRGTIRAKSAHTNADAADAERALEDFRQAEVFLDETTYLLGEHLGVNLTAASAYEAAGNMEARQQHLDEAAVIAQKLEAFPKDFQARRWRAYYFQEIDDLDSAIKEWQAVQRGRIGFAVMALYRAGRFEEALIACDNYRAATGTSDFCHSFTVAAIADSAEQLIADFRFDRQIEWNRNAARRSLYYLWSLAGQPERAIAEVRELGTEPTTSLTEQNLFAYVCGQITAKAYLDRSSDSRYAQTKAHLAIGLRYLSQGERDIARDHFQQALDCRMNYEFSKAVAGALLTQLDRDSEWPHWIPAK